MVIAVFNHPENGHKFNQEFAKKHLVLGQSYELTGVDMGQSSTTVFLKEFPDFGFNSIQFDFFEDGKELNIYRDPRFNPYLPIMRADDWAESAIHRFKKEI